MTREQAEEIADLHSQRDVVLDNLAQLRAHRLESVLVSFALNGGQLHRLNVARPFIASQWTAKLLDIERRIRAAGGTL